MALVLTALIWLPTLAGPQPAYAAQVGATPRPSASSEVLVAYAPTPVLM